MGISYDYILFLFTEAGNIDYCTCHICQVLLNKWMLPFFSVFLFVCKKIKKKALGHLFFCPERVNIPCLWMHILRAAYIHTNQVCFIIIYSSIPLPSTSHAHIHTHAYIQTYTPPTIIMYRMHCAHVPCPWVPITYFFSSVFFWVGLSYTSPALSTMEYYKRWRAEGGFVNGRRDVCQLTDQRAVGPLQMHPLHHTTPPSRWMGVSNISPVTIAGV